MVYPRSCGHYVDRTGRQPDRYTWLKLADALHTAVDYRLGRTDMPAAHP